MTDIRAQMDLLAGKLKRLTTRVEEKIAHLPDDKNVMTNSRAPRDIIAELEEYQWHIRCITKKMESLKETIGTGVEDVMEYLILSEELEKAKEKASNHEKIIRWLADTDVNRIYVYE